MGLGLDVLFGPKLLLLLHGDWLHIKFSGYVVGQNALDTA